jgi:hypothetical protein
MPRRRAAQLITAEELSCFAYCPEQWRLQHGLGLAPVNQDVLNAGVRHHARKAVAERLAAFLIMVGRALVIGALLVLALWWVLSR